MSEKHYLEAELTEIDGKDYFVATDSTTDREGEVLDVNGWELDNYKRNPVILWGHNASEPPIGMAEGISFRSVSGKKKLVFKPKFHDITQLARDVAKMVSEGIIKTVSVGFLPKEMKDNVINKLELLEISFVAVPANPEATQLALTKGVSNESIKQIFNTEPIEEKEEVEEDEVEVEEMTEAEAEAEVTDEEVYQDNDISEISEELKKTQERVAWLEREISRDSKEAPNKVESPKRNDTRRALIAVQKSCEALTQGEKKGSLKREQIKNITKLVEYLIREGK